MRYLNWLQASLAKDEKAKQKKIQVERLEITGLDRTREFVIRRALREIVNKKTTNLDELNEALKASIARLHDLQIFDKIDFELDAADNVIVRAHFRECGNKRVAVSTNVSSKGKTTLEVSASINNILGAAEQVGVDVEFDQQAPTKKFAINGRVMFPQVFHDGNWTNQVQLFAKSPLTSTLTQVTHGFTSIAQVYPRHTLFYDYEQRKLMHQQQQEKDSKPVELHTSVRSAISHLYRKSSLDNEAMPSSGMYLRVMNSLAGLGGSVHYVRSTLDADMYVPLVKRLGITGALHVSLGATVPYKDNEEVLINDRFFEYVRGYKQAIGPRSVEESGGQEQAVGGNVKALVTGRINFPLSAVSEYLYDWMGLHAHLFVTAGNVGNYDFYKNGDRQYNDQFVDGFLNGMKMSYGMGLAFMLSIGRIELNYCLPIQQKDAVVDSNPQQKVQMSFYAKF